MGVTLLPSDILVEIFVLLDFRGVLRCREVCTRFRTLVDEDVRAQYKLELAVAGMENSLPSTRTTAELLSLLHARQAAWSGFAWTAKEDIPLRGDYFWELYGNVLTRLEGERTLHFKQIPSATRGIEGTEWIITDVGCEITDFAIDPTQDLLVVFEQFWGSIGFPVTPYHVHLRALSTGAPHPAVPMAAMLTFDAKLDYYSYSIQISENYLGILMSDDWEEELVLWEWKTGTLRLRVAGLSISSWAFLTSRFILVAQTGYAYDKEKRRTIYRPHLLAVDLEAAPASSSSSNPAMLSEVGYVCAFRYPPFAEDTRVHYVDIRSEPGPGGRPSLMPGVPFSVSSEGRVLLITLSVSARPPERVFLRHIVPASTFLRALGTLAPGEVRHEFTWVDWAPCGSRLMTASETHSTEETFYVYGTMIASTEDGLSTQDGGPRKFVVMRDFSQRVIRRRAEGCAGDGKRETDMDGRNRDWRVMADATVFEPGGVFREEVTTALPYVEKTFVPSREETEGVKWDVMMLAEDALVMLANTRYSQLGCRILSF